MSNKTLGLSDALQAYLTQVSLREPPLLARLREETARDPMARMQIAPEQGQFMQLLLRLLGARRCIEIGVFTGYSSLCAALTLPDDGYLLACDVDENWTAVARRYWAEAGVTHKIELKLAPALDTLDAELTAGRAGSYDFAFIDADKSNYLNYYERCLRLLRPGGLIAVDNVLWDGRVADPQNRERDTEAIRVFNDFVRQDARVDISLVPIADGLLLCRRK
ncbi:MAG: class I SAM-dependent methyltransferase [Nevskiales bacterium]